MDESFLKKYYTNNKCEIKMHHSHFGCFLLTFIGMSAKPVKVEIIKKSFGKIVETITEEILLKNFIGR